VQSVNTQGLLLWRGRAVVQDAVQVATRTKVFAFAGQDNASHIGVGFRYVQSFNACAVYDGVQCISMLGVGEGQDQGLSLAVAFELGCHGLNGEMAQA
jgi:hypothetical protein